MELKVVCMTFTALVFICSPPAWAECTKTLLIFNFGDSNSDKGGYAAAYGSSFSSPNGHTYFSETSYRKCDGRLIIDFLCESVKANYLPSYMECLADASRGRDISAGMVYATPKAQIGCLRTSCFR